MTGLKKVLGACAPILIILAVFAISWLIQHVGDIDLLALFKAWIVPACLGYVIGYGYAHWRHR